MQSSTIKRKRRPRKKPGACQLPKCRRHGVVLIDERRLCAKHGADKAIGNFVKERDGCCVRCGSTGPLDWAHVVSRRYTAVRWSVGANLTDPWNNSVAFCRACHMWETTRPIEGEAFFRKLGIDVANLEHLAVNDPPQDPLTVLRSFPKSVTWIDGEQP